MTAKPWMLAAAALLLAAPVGAQSIATVSAAKGEVSLLDAATQAPRALAAAADGRVANGAVAPGDEVRTGAGASASLLFPDGSVVRIAESSRVSVTEQPIPGGGRKSIKRQILLKEGRIDCNAKPKTAIYTSIRTPLGIVGVRGTGLSVSATSGTLGVSVDFGQVFAMDLAGRAVFDLGEGQTVQFALNDQGQLLVQIPADSKAPVMATIGNARVSLGAGASIKVGGVAGERLTVTANEGKVSVTFPSTNKTTTLEKGKIVEVLGPDAPGPAPGAEAVDGAPAGADAYPPVPTVPAINDTIEASKFK